MVAFSEVAVERAANSLRTNGATTMKKQNH